MSTYIYYRCGNCGNEIEVSKNDPERIIFCPICKNKSDKRQFSFLSVFDNKGFVRTRNGKYVR